MARKHQGDWLQAEYLHSFFEERKPDKSTIMQRLNMSVGKETILKSHQSIECTPIYETLDYLDYFYM